MSDQQSNNDFEEMDFVHNKSFQTSIKKAKRKQTLKFFIIGSLSTIIILFVLYYAASYNLQRKISDDNEEMLFSRINGANVSQSGSSYVYSFLSAVSHITVEKNMGDRSILWNEMEEEIPAFGRKTVVDNGRFSETISFSERFNREVHYNSYNGEKEVAFYYPQIDYDYLPNELSIATDLDDNSLIEVALSFNQPYSVTELEELLGTENVVWLWVNTTPQNELENLADPDQHFRPYRYMDGPSADGFQHWGGDFTATAEGFLNTLKQLSEEGGYQSAAKDMAEGIKSESFPQLSDIKITGAVVTGTPDELQRFQEIEIVRASVIGATIDLY